LVTSLLLTGAKELLGEGTPVVLLGGPLITLVAVFVYRQLGTQAERARPNQTPVALPLSPQSLGVTAGVVVVATVAALGGSFLLGLGLDAVGLPVQEQGSVLEIADRARAGEAWGEAAMLVLAALILAPVAEELLFRQLLWRRVRRIAGPGLAYALSAFGFAAIHGNPAGVVIYAWLGVCFAAALSRTGRVGAAIAVHVANNAFVLVGLFFG
jgi:membrane protease YdiL (CAAX protease family)